MQTISNSNLARRRKASARFAWVVGAGALALYVIGFFIKR